jgi:Ca-activated chloride channel family protein
MSLALRALLPYGLVLVVALIVMLVIDTLLRRSGVTVSFHQPRALWLLLSVPLLAWVSFHLHAARTPHFRFSRVGDLARTRRRLISWLAPLPRVLRLVALTLVVFGLARPQAYIREEIQLEGIDLVIVLDVSKSMEEDDLRPNRMHAALRTVRGFLRGRKNDRIGLVTFAREATLSCPLTIDYGALDTIVAEIRIGELAAQGTAIGDGVGLAVGSLRRSDAKSKVVILLTDGDSNVANEMTPDDAIASAKKRGIRVFTVLVGKEAQGPLDPLDLRSQRYGVNPALLKRMAAETNGRYLNAADTAALDRVFEEVRATLEKTKRKEVKRTPAELFPYFVIPALALVLLEILLSLTRWRRFP